MTTTGTDTAAAATQHDDPPEQAAAAHPYPALRLLERVVPPLRFGQAPVWRAQLPAGIDNPLIPSWNWHAVRDFPPGTQTVTLSTNGAYLDAIAHAPIAHGTLQHTGRIPHPHHETVGPGYYRVTVPHWAFGGTIVSPLGDSSRLETEDAVWVAAPTLRLLLELAWGGFIGYFDVIDSFQALHVTSFRAWYEKLRAVRTQCLDQMEVPHPDPDGARAEDCACRPCRRYKALTDGYTLALAQMLTGFKCETYRPDWAQAVHATHAANQWRKAWRYVGANYPLVRLGHVDELTVPRIDLQAAMRREEPPFLVDASGRRNGAVRARSYGHIADDLPVQSADTLTTVAEWEDAL